jgi:hypothetical protein
MSRGMGGTLVAVGAMGAFWLLLVGSASPAELGGGVLGAAIATLGFHVVRSRDQVSFALRPGWLLLLLRRLPGHTLADCFRVLGTLWLVALGKPVAGRLARIPFEPGAPDDPYARARRALVVAGMSVAPNAVVVRIDGRDLLVHELVPTRTRPTDLEWPL